MVLPIRATGVMVGTGASAFADCVPRNTPAGRTTAVATTARARRRFRLRGLGTSPPLFCIYPKIPRPILCSDSLTSAPLVADKVQGRRTQLRRRADDGSEARP